MNFLSLFSSQSSAANSCEIQEIFPLKLQSADFIWTDLFTTYTKILTDTIERSHGLKEEFDSLLWDNCLQSEGNEGLVSMLAQAMTDKTDLFIVYVPSVKIIRRATREEEQQIQLDYKERRESTIGVWISFKSYKRTDMLAIHSGFEYFVLAGLNKLLNTSKALQFKIKDLRGTVSYTDSEIAKAQVREVAQALRNGNDVMLDKEDEVATTSPDTSPAEKSIYFIDGKKAFYLNMPISYISGEQTPGIGSTGEADMRAVERGLRQYFVSIIRPVLKALFDAEVEFKSLDFRNFASGFEAVKSFSLAGEGLISRESQQRVVAKLFDLDWEKEQAALEKEAGEQDVPGTDPAEKIPALPRGRSEPLGPPPNAGAKQPRGEA